MVDSTDPLFDRAVVAFCLRNMFLGTSQVDLDFGVQFLGQFLEFHITGDGSNGVTSTPVNLEYLFQNTPVIG